MTCLNSQPAPDSVTHVQEPVCLDNGRHIVEMNKYKYIDVPLMDERMEYLTEDQLAEVVKM